MVMELANKLEGEVAIATPEQTGFRWLVFDAVGTLIRPEPAVSSAYHAVAVRHGSKLSLEEIGHRFKGAFQASEVRDLSSSASAPDAAGRSATAVMVRPTSEALECERWRWIVRTVVDDLEDVEPCYLELFDHFARTESWRCFDDVAGMLPQLAKAGYRLAIASNFDDRLTGLVHGLPELASVERSIVSSLIGFRKPSADFYSALVRELDCNPAEMLMVGDDYANDVLGARRAGLSALLLRRTGTETIDEQEIVSLNDLPAWLGTRSASGMAHQHMSESDKLPSVDRHS